MAEAAPGRAEAPPAAAVPGSLTRRGPGGILGRGRAGRVLQTTQCIAHSGQLERTGHPQRAWKGPTAVGQLQAGEVAVQVGAPTGQLPAGVGDERTVLDHQPQQIGRVRPLPAAHAGADRRCHQAQPALSVGTASTAVASTAVASMVPGRATSGWMSMRQPVSRAASRAFWPSLPMANDSW